ncbi:MAG: hypothetical protein KKA59_08430 [Candidatus Omnitrophica bacterium]|nr:hypothetical protein [Candidatus Omnitrophota bacterium]
MREIAIEKSAEAGEPMWYAYGEWVPAPVTLKEIQSYTEDKFERLPKERKIKIYRFLLKQKIEKLWNRFCLLSFIVAPLLLLISGISSRFYMAVIFLFYTIVYIIYLAHKIGHLEGYDKGYTDLKERDTYRPEGINLKFKKIKARFVNAENKL